MSLTTMSTFLLDFYQIGRVVQQLRGRAYYLYVYLDALTAKDPHLTSEYADIQVRQNIPAFVATLLNEPIGGIIRKVCAPATD